MKWTIKQQEQANYFAICLLMPEEHYRKIFEKNTDPDGIVHTDRIAEYFGVSIGVAKMRGVDLGLLKADL